MHVFPSSLKPNHISKPMETILNKFVARCECEFVFYLCNVSIPKSFPLQLISN